MKSLILGSSPNAFSAALTLAEAGHQVDLIEPAAQLGAPYHTRPEDGAEMGLAYLHFCPQLAARFKVDLPLLRHAGRTAIREDGSIVRLTSEGLEGAPEQDRHRWPQFVQLLDQCANLLGQLLHNPHPPGELQEQWRALGRRQSMEVLRLPWMSLRDLLDEWFADETLKGTLAGVALEGVCGGPFACGTVFHLLRRWAQGEVLQPATVAGGSSAWIQALAQAAQGRGVKVCHSPGTPQLEWLEGRPGKLLLNQQSFEFDQLLSDKDVRWTYTQLVSPRYLETEFNAAVHKVRGRGVWQRGVGQAPWPSAWPQSSQKDIIHLQPGLRDLERAYDRLKRRQDCAGPVQLCWPHFLDAQRPANLVQETYGYGGGRSLPEISQRKLFGPQDFESAWNMPEGQLWGGERDLSQSFFLRPIPAYEAELPHLDLCGASLHPADYSGRAGQWAAQKVLQALATT